MTRPLIGLVCCRSDATRDPIHFVADRYVSPVAEHSGAAVVLLPALSQRSDATTIASRIDGLVVAGSPSNVEPSRYGSAATGCGPFDPARDETSIAMIRAMAAVQRPIFGICRGMQEINVAFGGTLKHLGPTATHHAETDDVGPGMFSHRHPVRLVDGGKLAEQAGEARCIDVNSVHYQSVARLGDHLVAEALAHDGTIEAFSARNASAPVLAVQWHPEWNAGAWEGSILFFSLMRQALGTE